MCGIAGIINVEQREPVAESDIRQMLAMIRHRGPDQFGVYVDDQAGLGSARLSIIDLSSGQQPIANEDGSLWIVFNGEIFNYVELRPKLESCGHRFSTLSDTEVLLHLYEEYGPACLDHLNGQFAFAIWNTRDRSLFLARDRLGVRPVFYTINDGRLIFGSEVKAVLAADGVDAQLDLTALDEVFTYWSPLSPRTAFCNIQELPPGHYLTVHYGSLKVKPYWHPAFPPQTDAVDHRTVDECVEEFRDLLTDAVRIRLRADVPVGAYLSGGLDSSAIAGIVRRLGVSKLDTFSISFSDPQFDESRYQKQMAKFLGTEHQVVYATHADIGRVFPEVIWHTEMPLMRTGPAPMFLLSKLVRSCGYKVVLTGEGADEFLAGYDIFKETMIRRCWSREPSSHRRPRLLQRLYPDIAGLSQTNGAYLKAFFGSGLESADDPYFSHAIRWKNNSRTRRFLLNDQAKPEHATANDRPSFPKGFSDWHPLARAQYFEISLFLSHYLLSSQGDRPAMAHAVEGRYPFLDMRVVEFCNRLPAGLKLSGLRDKLLLRHVAREWLPDEICQRGKRPYRAPIHRSFFNETTPAYVRELLAPKAIQATGIFKSNAVENLVAKIGRGMPLGETDDMALVGILSTQLLHWHFITHFQRAAPLSEADDVKVVNHYSNRAIRRHRHACGLQPHLQPL